MSASSKRPSPKFSRGAAVAMAQVGLAQVGLVLAGLALAGIGACLEPVLADAVAPPRVMTRTDASRSGATRAGLWTIAMDKGSAVCRVMLRQQRADAGDYFLGMPAACRHAMPGLETVGRWGQPDATHLSLDDPAGKPILVFAAATDGGFVARAAEGGYTMRQIGPGEPADRAPGGFDAVDPRQAAGFATVQPIVSRKPKEVEPVETAEDLAGRYAVMREKRDTGCMVTLDDKSRGAGGSRAQLAPGCRDQGIVIFDPSGWRIVKGELVLTARAGHKTVLDKHGEGLWEKDTKDGAKPLGLKKL